MVKGYKGMKQDMSCRDFQYEIGKEYLADGDIKLCGNGFHFCKNLKDVFEYYGNDRGNRFFEVEGNVIESDGVKCVADKIIIVRELTEKEVNRCDCSGSSGNGYYGESSGDGYGEGYGTDGCGSGCGDGSNGYDGNHGDGCGSTGYGDGYGDGIGYGFGRVTNIEKVLKFI